MLASTAIEEVRARLGELTADFWTGNEVYRALNEGLKRFAAQEQWPWLFTRVTNGSLAASTEDFVLPSTVDFSRFFHVQCYFSGDSRPRMPRRVTPSEGIRLGMQYYTDTQEPVAYYISAGARGLADIQTLEFNDIAAADTFKLTHNSLATATVTYSADMTADITSALEGIASFEPGDFSVSQTDTNTYVVTFDAALGPVSALTITNASGFTPTGVTNTQDGTPGDFLYTLTFVPASTTAMTLKYTYVRTPATASTGTDVLDIPEQYAMGPVAYATGLLWLKELQDSKKADEQFGLFAQVVDDAKRESRRLGSDEGFAWGRNEPEGGLVTASDEVYRHFSGPLG